MNKKYTIINTNSNSQKFNVDYFFYIVILFLIIYLIFSLITNNYKDNFVSNLENFTDNLIQSAIPNTQPNTQPNMQANKGDINLSNTQANMQANMQANKGDIILSNTQANMQANMQANIHTNKGDIILSNTQSNIKPSLKQLYEKTKIDNMILQESKNLLEKNLKKQERAVYLSSIYNKVDESSFENELDYINTYFSNTILPTNSFENKKIISNEHELDNLIHEAKNFKNIYSVGDIVTNNSNFNIKKDNICYKDHLDHIANDLTFKEKYPECMVCSINPNSSYLDTKSWKNTKTNIHKVCLFNPDAKSHSDILNYEGCKKSCSINEYY